MKQESLDYQPKQCIVMELPEIIQRPLWNIWQNFWSYFSHLHLYTSLEINMLNLIITQLKSRTSSSIHLHFRIPSLQFGGREGWTQNLTCLQRKKMPCLWTWLRLKSYWQLFGDYLRTHDTRFTSCWLSSPTHVKNIRNVKIRSWNHFPKY